MTERRECSQNAASFKISVHAPCARQLAAQSASPTNVKRSMPYASKLLCLTSAALRLKQLTFCVLCPPRISLP